MGAGAVLIPGGNYTLMIKSLPGLSPHAIPAFVALLSGIGITLRFMRLLTGKTLIAFAGMIYVKLKISPVIVDHHPVNSLRKISFPHISLQRSR